MRFAAFSAALMLASAATPAMADGHMEKKEAPAEKLTIDNTIEELMANETAAAILEKHLPGIDKHPAYDQFKSMNLVALQPWSAGVVTDEIIAAIKADLEAMA